MKTLSKTIGAMLLALAMLFAGCQKYDDSALSGRVDDLEGRVSELEKLVADLNSNVQTLSASVKALENEDRIVSITPLSDGSGYEIVFSKMGKMVIKNGEKPSISVEQGEDGVWYWTVDGEPLLADGNKIPATIAPEFKIENGQLWFRLNGGEWTVIPGAETGIGLVQDVRETEEDVTLVLSDGREITIPKVQSFKLNVEVPDYIGISAGNTITIPYTITAGDDKTKVAAIAGNGFTATVSGNSQSGTISITAPSELPTESRIIIQAVNGNTESSAVILIFEEGELIGVNDTYTIGAQGGEIKIELETNYLNITPFIDPNPNNSWLTIVSIPESKSNLRKETITLNAESYENGSGPRSATVNLIYDGGIKQITVTQLHTDISNGGSADFETFTTEPGRFMTPITDNTANGWTINNSYLRSATSVQPNAKSKFPALIGSTQCIGTLSSPDIEGGCGRLTIAIAGSKLPNMVPNGIKVNVSILQNNTEVKTFALSITSDEYIQSQVFEKFYDVNLSGNFKIIITNGCPSNLTGSGSTYEDAYIPSVSWTGYSE